MLLTLRCADRRCAGLALALSNPLVLPSLHQDQRVATADESTSHTCALRLDDRLHTQMRTCQAMSSIHPRFHMLRCADGLSARGRRHTVPSIHHHQSSYITSFFPLFIVDFSTNTFYDSCRNTNSGATHRIPLSSAIVTANPGQSAPALHFPSGATAIMPTC